VVANTDGDGFKIKKQFGLHVNSKLCLVWFGLHVTHFNNSRVKESKLKISVYTTGNRNSV